MQIYIPLEPSVVLYTFVDRLLMIEQRKMYDSPFSLGQEHSYVKKGNSRDAFSSYYILQERVYHDHICSPSQIIRKGWYDFTIISYYVVIISVPCDSLKWYEVTATYTSKVVTNILIDSFGGWFAIL